MMDIRPVRSEATSDWALAEIEAYFDHEPAPGSNNATRFDVRSALTEGYESRHWPVDMADGA